MTIAELFHIERVSHSTEPNTVNYLKPEGTRFHVVGGTTGNAYTKFYQAG